MKLNLSIFYLYFYGHIKEIIAKFTVRKIVLFSSNSFTVLPLKFRSSIQCELIFEHSVWYGPNFILLRVAVQLPQYHLLKDTPFLHRVVLAPLLKIM